MKILCSDPNDARHLVDEPGIGDDGLRRGCSRGRVRLG